MKITIPKPCHENWETMTPEEKGRFCSVCSKTVRDFTVASDQEIIEAFSDPSMDICGNFNASQLNRNLNYSFINSLFTKFAVGFILTTGGFVSVNAQQNTVKDTLKTEEIREIVFSGFNKQRDRKLLGAVSVIPGNLLVNTQQNDIPVQLSGVIGKVVSTKQIESPFHHKKIIGGASLTIRNNEKPLYIINGKLSSLEELNMVDPKMIKSINIMKDTTAIYGVKAKNGVIVITTKKKEKLKK
ncbi:TonB-dependent receptor plug domain-containing protein [Chryseobacterium sp. JM1]|uniref:TonB-dependent receptor plug domain-containing protein n=1 Tax=Chryseobacterium sp. JM1 TaxID=1233950 RepID=UPI0004E77F63|nr:TonB-dependent receptor plug domain-containing protein [Chryseobacterium sp. JM1]KFF21567.1 hypothetical protein IW22_06315 [Chryseobacterium sp. JM1]